MTADSAEAALRALARDLVEEAAAGRALELARDMDDDLVELATFNVRPFQRMQRTRTGKIIPETVRGHIASREHWVSGEPGHEVGSISPAQWTANQWGHAQKISDAISDTRHEIRPVSAEERYDKKGAGHPEKVAGRDAFAHATYAAEDKDSPSADDHLARAQSSLNYARSADSPSRRGEHLAEAYSHLAEAHRHATEHVLPGAASAEGQKAVRAALARIQGHMAEMDKLTGGRGAATKQIAGEVPALDAGRAKALDKVREAIHGTSDAMFGNGLKTGQQRGPVHHLWMDHPDSPKHVSAAWSALGAAQGGDKEALATAYHHLAEAHRLGVEQALSRAHLHDDPAVKDQVRKHLDRIQAHMEALDKVAGTSPEMTRKLLGAPAQHEERASAVRDEARRAAGTSAEAGKFEGELARGTGLLDSKTRGDLANRAAEVRRAQQDQATIDKLGLAPGDPVRVPTQRGGKQAGTLVGFGDGKDGRTARVDIGGGLVKEYPVASVERGQVSAPRGASAIYPQVGQHLLKPAGGSISGHENMGRAVPAAVAQPFLSPEAAALEAANKKVETLTQRESQRQQQDLKDHLAAIRATEAERQGLAAEGEYAPLTDEQFAAHTREVEAKLEQALRDGHATWQRHTENGDGVTWSPQRAILHAEVLHDYMDKQVDVPSRREVLFLGGLSGAGKTTLMKDQLKDYAVLNPDDFKEELIRRGAAPGVQGLSPMEASTLVHEESVYLANVAAEMLSGRGKNMAWDVTMNNRQNVRDWLEYLKHPDSGYTARGVFVDVPVEVSADRAMSRYRRELEAYRAGKSELGGRYIPRYAILQGEAEPGVSRASRNFTRLKGEFSHWAVYDGTGDTSKPVASGGTSQAGHGIPSVEELRRQVSGYTGSTEQSAGQAEHGGAAEAAARAAEKGQQP